MWKDWRATLMIALCACSSSSGTSGAGDAGDAAVEVSCPAPAGPAVQRSCDGTGAAGCGLVEVVGGTFTMGAPECVTAPGPSCAENGSPPIDAVTVGSFALDAYEVTVSRFRAFWNARPDGGAPACGWPIRYPHGAIAWRSPGRAPSEEPVGFCNWRPTPGAHEAHPINCVSWQTAQEFCVWDGGRLPTEAEWEYAARGRAVDGLRPGRVYPWGDEAPSPSCDRAHWNNCPGADVRFTRRVGGFPLGASGGLYDLAGNVGEFTADWQTNYGVPPCWASTTQTDPLCATMIPDAQHVVRGGSWNRVFGLEPLRSASRYAYVPSGDAGNADVGFRCARTR